MLVNQRYSIVSSGYFIINSLFLHSASVENERLGLVVYEFNVLNVDFFFM